MDPHEPFRTLHECFGPMKDPRIERDKRHKLIDILIVAICAVVSGADNWTEIEEFGNATIEWLRRLVELPNGIPSHDTFGDLFARLCPKQLKQCLSWVRSVFEVTQGQVIAIHGKRLRRCFPTTATSRCTPMRPRTARTWAGRNPQVSLHVRSFLAR